MSGLYASVAQSITATTLRAYFVSTSSHRSANSFEIPKLSICSLNSYKLAFYLVELVYFCQSAHLTQYPRGRAEELGEHSLLDLRECFWLEPLYQWNAGIDMECADCRFGGSWFLELPWISMRISAFYFPFHSQSRRPMMQL